MSNAKVTPLPPVKLAQPAKVDEPELRRSVSAHWSHYLNLLSRGLEDHAALHELNQMHRAVTQLRDALGRRAGCI